MPSEASRALVLSAVEESFGALSAMTSGFDAALRHIQTTREEAGISLKTSTSPQTQMEAAVVDAHSELAHSCEEALSCCTVPESTEPGRLIRERLSSVATWMHMTIDRVAGLVDTVYGAEHTYSCAIPAAASVALSADGVRSTLSVQTVVSSDGGQDAATAAPSPAAKRRTSPPARAASAAAARRARAGDGMQLSTAQLRVAGQVASSPYALSCDQEFAVARPQSASKFAHVKSRVAEMVHGFSRTTSVEGEVLDPFSPEALQRKVTSVTSGVAAERFESDWDCIDKDATITDRRVQTPSKDARLGGLLRNLTADRRDYVMFKSAMRSVTLRGGKHEVALQSVAGAVTSTDGTTSTSAADTDASRSRARPATAGVARAGGKSDTTAAMESFGTKARVEMMHELAGTTDPQPVTSAPTASTSARRSGAPTSAPGTRAWVASGSTGARRTRPSTAGSVPRREVDRSTASQPSMHGVQPSADESVKQRSFTEYVRSLRHNAPAETTAKGVASGDQVTVAVTSTSRPPSGRRPGGR